MGALRWHHRDVSYPRVFALLALLGFLTSCASGGGAPKADTSPRVEAPSGRHLPASAFLHHPLISQVKLSPSGEYLAAVSRKGVREVLVVRPTSGAEFEGLVAITRDRFGPSSHIERIGWASDDKLILVTSEPDLETRVEARRTLLFSVTRDGEEFDYLAEDWPDVDRIFHQGRIISYLPKDPANILVGVRLPGANYPGARRVKLSNGSLRNELSEIWGVYWWATDREGDIRAIGGSSKPRGGFKEGALTHFVMARASADDSFEEIVRWNPFTEDGFEFVEFSSDPEVIYAVFASEDGARHEIHRYDIVERQRTGLVYADPEYDVDTIVTSNLDGRPLYVLYEAERPKRHFFDADWRTMMNQIDRALPDRVNAVTSRNLDETVLVIRSYSDVVPPEYYVFDRRTLTLELIAELYPELQGVELSPMEPVSFAARDGLRIHGYLTKPPNASSGPLPTIIFPHGGPFARDVWGWDPAVQFLASRGFAVLQINFRGSDGYGEEFEQRGWGEWGLAMQDDITDGTRWLIDQGVADPDRIGIYGGSYGGYAALQALATEPDLYAAGASYAGVTDLRMTLSEDKMRLRYDDWSARLIGERRGDREKLIATSPAHNADKIRVPVLIGHGTRDDVVRVAEAEVMIKALERAGVPVESAIYEDELHAFLDDRKRADFYEKLASFFTKHLMRADPTSEP